jgi:hypothetical protein
MSRETGRRPSTNVKRSVLWQKELLEKLKEEEI